MIVLFLLLMIQADQASPAAADANAQSSMTFEQAAAALAEVKTNIAWSDKERRYSCSLTKGSGIAWLDSIPCNALSKCETGKRLKQEELVPCFSNQAANLVNQVLKR
jgi:hypothetical protein